MSAFVRRYDVPLYRSALHVAIADTIAEGVETLPDALRDFEWPSSKEACAATSPSVCNTIAVVVRDEGDLEFSAFAHEATHVIKRLMAGIGMGPLNDDTEEAYAYLGDFIITSLRSAHDDYVAAKRTTKEAQ